MKKGVKAQSERICGTRRISFPNLNPVVPVPGLNSNIAFRCASWLLSRAKSFNRKPLIFNVSRARSCPVVGGGDSTTERSQLRPKPQTRNFKAQIIPLATSRQTISIATPTPKISGRLPEYDS